MQGNCSELLLVDTSYQRNNKRWSLQCPITLKEAIMGFSSSVTHLDGRSIPIRMPSATPDSVKIIPGDGMPNSKTRTKGDLKVTFSIRFPELNTDEREQIGKILSRRG